MDYDIYLSRLKSILQNEEGQVHRLRQLLEALDNRNEAMNYLSPTLKTAEGQVKELRGVIALLEGEEKSH